MDCPKSYPETDQPPYPSTALHESTTCALPGVAETTGVETNGNGKNPALTPKLAALDVPAEICPMIPHMRKLLDVAYEDGSMTGAITLYELEVNSSACAGMKTRINTKNGNVRIFVERSILYQGLGAGVSGGGGGGSDVGAGAGSGVGGFSGGDVGSVLEAVSVGGVGDPPPLPPPLAPPAPAACPCAICKSVRTSSLLRH